MDWLFIAFQAVCWVFAGYNFYRLWEGRRYRVGDIVWVKGQNCGKRIWVLARIRTQTEFKYVYYVDIFDGGPKDFCIGSHQLRPIRWWQRTKVDPIVMKYYLLNGWDE